MYDCIVFLQYIINKLVPIEPSVDHWLVECPVLTDHCLQIDHSISVIGADANDEASD